MICTGTRKKQAGFAGIEPGNGSGVAEIGTG